MKRRVDVAYQVEQPTESDTATLAQSNAAVKSDTWVTRVILYEEFKEI
jgi:hypothetical protein